MSGQKCCVSTCRKEATGLLVLKRPHRDVMGEVESQEVPVCSYHEKRFGEDQRD